MSSVTMPLRIVVCLGALCAMPGAMAQDMAQPDTPCVPLGAPTKGGAQANAVLVSALCEGRLMPSDICGCTTLDPAWKNHCSDGRVTAAVQIEQTDGHCRIVGGGGTGW